MPAGAVLHLLHFKQLQLQKDSFVFLELRFSVSLFFSKLAVLMRMKDDCTFVWDLLGDLLSYTDVSNLRRWKKASGERRADVSGGGATGGGEQQAAASDEIQHGCPQLRSQMHRHG